MRLSFQKQRGFTLIEMLVATLIMLIGLVAAAQLVPFAIQLNTANRYDSTALVIAQRQMEGMLNQPLSATAFTDPWGALATWEIPQLRTRLSAAPSSWSMAGP